MSRTILFNPYTGEKRDMRDVKSDPEGLLIAQDFAQVKAAGKPKNQINALTKHWKKETTDKILVTWFLISITSLVLYAFTGVGIWSGLQAADGFARFILLFAFHVAGVAAFPISRSLK